MKFLTYISAVLLILIILMFTFEGRTFDIGNSVLVIKDGNIHFYEKRKTHEFKGTEK